jgi:hypothetical protein
LACFVKVTYLVYIKLRSYLGVSYTFGGDVVMDFLKKHDITLIARAHKVKYSTVRMCILRKIKKIVKFGSCEKNTYTVVREWTLNKPAHCQYRP